MVNKPNTASEGEHDRYIEAATAAGLLATIALGAWLATQVLLTEKGKGTAPRSDPTKEKDKGQEVAPENGFTQQVVRDALLRQGVSFDAAMLRLAQNPDVSHAHVFTTADPGVMDALRKAHPFVPPPDMHPALEVSIHRMPDMPGKQAGDAPGALHRIVLIAQGMRFNGEPFRLLRRELSVEWRPDTHPTVTASSMTDFLPDNGKIQPMDKHAQQAVLGSIAQIAMPKDGTK